MLPEDQSATQSKKSDTSSRSNSSGLLTPIQFVKGVGPKLGALFASRGIATVGDLLHFFPRAYEDRSRLRSIAELEEGVKTSISIQIQSVRRVPTRTGRNMLEARGRDAAGSVNLKWFYAPPGLESRLKVGTQLIVNGTPKKFLSSFEIVHPELNFGLGGDADPHAGRIVPIYVEIEQIPTRILRRVLWECLQKFLAELPEDLPEELRQKYSLPRFSDAVMGIHFPNESVDAEKLIAFATPAHERLIYEEFLKFEYLILRKRLRMEKQRSTAIPLSLSEPAVADLRKILPFELTDDQNKAISEILKDIAEPHPMNRLIQGDVGSGKTAVALLTASAVLAQGGQVALMAPTEILAEQHLKNARQLFGDRVPTLLLSGKTSNKDRQSLITRLKSGEPILVIGTHALLEDPIEFKNLQYILVDEQHRFGVEQRRILRRKGIVHDPLSGERRIAHFLVLTATPIPRTLALTVYGDLAVTQIRQMPKGRSPITTKIVTAERRGEMFQHIRAELKAGRQAYFIYPLIEASEAEGFTSLKAATVEVEKLQQEIFPDFKVAILHGQMKPAEKSDIMERFKRNEFQVLVSTTVVEVGVDVPNATVMVIEHAERFGLSQLHQLRGRVGRGIHRSMCFLMAPRYQGEKTGHRLQVLEDSTDGFVIAEADLELRGPGEFLGTRQTGDLPFKVAHLVRDQTWLIKAREDAIALLKEDPDLKQPRHLSLRRYLEREGKLQSDRLQTS